MIKVIEVNKTNVLGEVVKFELRQRKFLAMKQRIASRIYWGI